MKTPKKGHSLSTEFLTSIAAELGIEVDDLQSIVIKVKPKANDKEEVGDKMLEMKSIVLSLVGQRLGFCHCRFDNPGVMRDTCCDRRTVCCLDE